MDLALIFMVLMGASVLAYVVLDGYDLGVGMLMPAASEAEQSTMVASIGPFWDANETWLVLGIGVLLAAFPLAHGIVLQALYIPVVAMLGGLLHGVVLPGRDARALRDRLRAGLRLLALRARRGSEPVRWLRAAGRH